MASVNLRIDWCSHEAAKFAVEHWHYSRCIPKSKLAKFGVWENDRFIGCVIFGVGATNTLVRRYGLVPEQGCELVRVALHKHQTSVSRIVAICLKLLKKTMVGLRLVVSFADPEHGHHGGIYQAGGWVFVGNTSPSDEYIYKGKRWQGRSFRNSHKGMENSPFVTRVKGSSKHRYLMPLDDGMKSIVEKMRLPYPKRAGSAAGGTAGIQPVGGGSTPTPALSSTTP